MPLPEIELHRVNKLFTKFCNDRIPPEVRSQIKLLFKFTGNKVILIESRPYYDDPSRWSEMPVAQFEYSATTKSWSLYGYNRNDKRLPLSKGTLEKLIQEVDKDATGIFWG
jgi:hypothetical protein